jgi:predicted Zn-dependent protease with MMP-like domain
MLRGMEDPSPDLLGLFVGIPLTERSVSDLADLSSITLFTRNLERSCSDGAELVEEIRVTLLHEIGHYLGMTEEELEEAGYS